ncbi:unnamed protein product [Closterium sp. Yama58-4]|nr:unnamed protein product [Closterium sp. Yama58-4]
MLFHAAGAEGSRPTFFEMAAADFLPASLQAAALYALGVLAQHRPSLHCCSLHRLLDHSHELSAAALRPFPYPSTFSHSLQTTLYISPCRPTICNPPSVFSSRDSLPSLPSQVVVIGLDQSDAFLVLGSDGLWEYVGDDEAIGVVVAAGSIEAGVKALLALAKERWLKRDGAGYVDDVTALVVGFTHRKV